jgi:hypothetical protein
MTTQNYEEIARGNVERYLSDAVMEDGEDAIYDSAYTLALDALVDAGAPLQEAREIAVRVAQAYAQP